MSKMVTIPDSGGIRVGVKLVNPSVARRWLSLDATKDVGHRRPSPYRISRESNSIKIGEWILGEPLMFNCKGGMMDGQTRLLAVIDSGMTVPFIVMEGFEEKVFTKINKGWERKLAHCLQMEKEQRASTLATVVIMAAKDAQGLIPSASNRSFFLTSDEGIDLLKEDPSIRESVLTGSGVVSPYASRAMLAFCHWKFSRINKADTNEFLIELSSSKNQEEGDPIYLLRERLKSNKRSKSKISRTETLALIYKAWNAVRKNEKLHNLRWRRSGNQAENFPVPI